MGSIIMDKAVVQSRVTIGAGSVVPPNKVLESGFLYVGSPVRQIRPLNDRELEFLEYSAQNYRRLRERHLHAQMPSAGIATDDTLASSPEPKQPVPKT